MVFMESYYIFLYQLPEINLKYYLVMATIVEDVNVS